MAYSMTDYAHMLQGLLPRGLAWKHSAQGRMGLLFQAAAQELGRLEGDAVRLLQEIDPQQADESIADWEQELGLPDECAGQADSLEARREAVMRKLQRGGGLSRSYFSALLKQFGYDGITLAEAVPMMVDHGRADDLLFSERQAHTFYVAVPNTLTVRRFRTGSGRTPEHLLDWTETNVECVISREKPAHAHAIFHFIDTEE